MTDTWKSSSQGQNLNIAMNTILTWLQARLTESTTYTGLAGLLATILFHKQLGASDAAQIGTIAAGVVSGALVAITSHNPTQLVSTVVSDIPGVITVAGDLKAQAAVALAGGEPAKAQALLDAHEKSQS